jgi:hypothetical protein
MEERMTPKQQLRRLVMAQPGADPAAIAAEFRAEAGDNGMVAVLADYIRELQRLAVAERERSTFASVRELFADDVPAASGAGAARRLGPELLERFQPLFGCVFETGKGAVLWELATVEQHQARIAYQEQVRRRFNDAIDQDIENHRTASEVITAAGVRCLAEIGARVAVAV